MENENNYTNNELNNNVNEYLNTNVNNINTEIQNTQINNNLNNTPKVETPIKESSGFGRSITSAIIFFLVCIPYFIGCFQDDYGMFIVMGGFLLLPFIIICYILARLAVSDYKKFSGKKTIFRKIFNIINIISLAVITIPLILFIGILLGLFAVAFPPPFIIALVCITAITSIYIYIKQRKKKGGKI